MPVSSANLQYYYDDEDIQGLIRSHNSDRRIKWTVPISIKENEAVHSVEALAEDFRQLREGEKLLLPLNDDRHWIGAMVEKMEMSFALLG